jgi:hypothetical protein
LVPSCAVKCISEPARRRQIIINDPGKKLLLAH